MDNDNIHSAYRGDIFYADLEPVRGSEQGGVRPVLIIQNDIGNRHSPTVIVAAITSRIKHHRLPTHVNLNGRQCGLHNESTIMLEQLRTLDKRRLLGYAGTVGKGKMQKVNAALTRRTGEVAVDGLQFHNLRLDSQNYTLSYGQEQIKLSLKEYQIMEIFMSNPKQIVSKEFFIEKIWGYESDVEYNNIEVYISFLRKKLQSIHANISIKTARGIGYFLEEQPA